MPSTTPTQTPTVSPTLAPDAVPTPSPSVTVRPTPTVAPTAGKTTLTNARLVSGTASAPRVYDNVVFKGGDSTHGVLHIDYDLHDVIIRNAIVETGPQNGITINATDSVTVRNITFQNVTVKAATCMGIEITDRTYSGRTVSNYQYITLDGVTVEPAGAEGISFDNNPKGAAYVTVRNTVIEGSGNRPDRYPWGQGFELNGVRNVTVSGLTVRQTRGPAFNLSGVGTSTPANWTFTNVVADMRVRDSQQTQSMGRESQVIYMKNATGVRFSGLVATAPTGSFNGYFDNVRNTNFTGTTWQRSGASPHVSEVNGSTGNIGLP